MQHLWAPWRIGYIRGPREEGCFLCRKSQENADDANFIVLRQRTCFALLNTYPYTAGHLMVAPYKHTGGMDELAAVEMAEMMEMVRECTRLLTRILKPQGFNIGLNIGAAAGAGVLDHLHWHIVPRWVGDTNFMPVLADARVLPQSLEELYRYLKEDLTKPSQSS
jgi:ATP adenylyltransferase